MFDSFIAELCKQKLLSSSLCANLVDFLDTQNGDDHFESVLDILIAVAEWGKDYTTGY